MSARILAIGPSGLSSFVSRHMVRAALEFEIEELGSDLLVTHGAGSGSDAVTEVVAGQLGLARERFPPDWDGPCRPACEPGHRRPNRYTGTFCPAAADYRDQAMIALRPVHCLAFLLPGRISQCRTTRENIRRALAAGITVRTYESRA